MYGAPFWDQGRVTADNPVERLESYRNKRIFLVCGLDEDVNETPVRKSTAVYSGSSYCGMPGLRSKLEVRSAT